MTQPATQLPYAFGCGTRGSDERLHRQDAAVADDEQNASWSRGAPRTDISADGRHRHAVHEPDVIAARCRGCLGDEAATIAAHAIARGIRQLHESVGRRCDAPSEVWSLAVRVCDDEWAQRDEREYAGGVCHWESR